VERQAVRLESTPPLRPTTTPSQPAFAQLVRIKPVIVSFASMSSMDSHHRGFTKQYMYLSGPGKGKANYMPPPNIF
jgi:hypothetical protein